MGKWSEYRKQFQLLPVDPEWQDKVTQLARGFRKLSHVELGRAFSRAKLAKQKLEDKLKLMNVELEALTQLLVRWFEDHEQEKFTLMSGITISLKDDVYPQVDNQAAFFSWIKATRSAYLLSVHHKKLEGLVKGKLEAGEKLPPGIKVFFKTSVARRGKFEKESDSNGQEKGKEGRGTKGRRAR